jgi:hypothetical protein
MPITMKPNDKRFSDSELAFDAVQPDALAEAVKSAGDLVHGPKLR